MMRWRREEQRGRPWSSPEAGARLDLWRAEDRRPHLVEDTTATDDTRHPAGTCRGSLRCGVMGAYEGRRTHAGRYTRCGGAVL